MSLIDESRFPPTSEADWRARISSEGDRKDLDTPLKWTVEPGLVLDAVATSLSNAPKPTLPVPEFVGQLSDAAGSDVRSWRILTGDKELNDERAVVLDVRSNTSPVHTDVQQCAIAAANLKDRADSLETGTHVRAIVPVSHCVVLEVAKLMAMRSLLKNLVRRSMGPANTRESGSETMGDRVELFAVAGGHCTCPDPETHQIRLTFACLASVLGAADAVLPVAFEDTEQSRRLAENVLLILRHEAGMAAVQRITSGSYYLERAASKIEEAALNLLGRIADAGGLKAALSGGLLAPVERAKFRQSEFGV